MKKIAYNNNKKNTLISVIGKLARGVSCVPLRTALASAAVVMFSGCAMTPDRAATSSFVAAESGYPEMAPTKRKMVRPEKVIKSTLPAKVASYSFLGRAPYICTPSGFGRTSGCFLRKG